jgi:hypothetical protein
MTILCPPCIEEDIKQPDEINECTPQILRNSSDVFQDYLSLMYNVKVCSGYHSIVVEHELIRINTIKEIQKEQYVELCPGCEV